MKRLLLSLAAVLLSTACTELTPPLEPHAEPQSARGDVKPQNAFDRLVALGTSISMGVDGAGVYADAQRAAWPSQLAATVGASFGLPLVEDPGCPPPLLAPLALHLVLLGAFSALGAGDDLLTAVTETCMPLQPQVDLTTTGNLAISGARAHDALYMTPEAAAAHSASRGALYSRVLPPGHTQVSAMLARNPTFVLVELASNELLPAAMGTSSAMHPYDDWVRDYDQVISAVQSTGARALLVGLPDRAANFPSVRTAREFFHEWPYLLTLGISVSISCYFSPNHLFIPGYLLTLLLQAPTTATCSDAPGTVDYVLAPADMSEIDARLARMNDHIEQHAFANGYAFFSISVLYDLPKPRFSVYDVLFSSKPFGPYTSIDGVHPNAAGQRLLADAAVDAIRARYRNVIR
jgi:hypothetical protein